MSEDTDIDILPPEMGEAVETKPKQRFGLPILLSAMFVASALGAGAMYFAANMLKTPAPNLSPLTASVETLKRENKTLKTQIAGLQSDIKAIPKAETVNLSVIKSRLENLEKIDPQTIDPDLIARLEALKSDGSEALDLSDILARIDALESRPATIMAAPVAARAEKPDTQAAMAFPAAKIMTVLDKAEASQGWLKKSLNKHISVQSEDNPRYLLELAVKNIEAENIEAAIAAFDKLPADAKAAGQDWRDSVESN